MTRPLLPVDCDICVELRLLIHLDPFTHSNNNCENSMRKTTKGKLSKQFNSHLDLNNYSRAEKATI